jgi:hypothetical protein
MVYGTDSTRTRQSMFMGGLNSVAYKGSLQDGYRRWTPAYQIGVAFRKKKLVNGMVSLTFGRFIGEDRNYKLPSNADPRQVVNSRFETSFFSIHYEAQFTLFAYRGFRAFAAQGLGLLRFTVKDWEGNNLASLDQSRAKGETYGSSAWMLPTQLGVRYRFSNQLEIQAQAGWMNVFSPFLDNMNELGPEKGNDNLAAFRFQVLYPIGKRK